ncbi:hypothetical protein [Mycolicibacterium llatzerense]|jgi:hypothetical protein|uniref:hypothetical protein n=1 Tax=Mycolicibacterium llatzerense TaxID=280871 RepID=UPI000A482341|nr:hypothetical protein [Mycolicibacterium llatzerense]
MAAAAALNTDALSGVSKPEKRNIEAANASSVPALAHATPPHPDADKRESAEHDFDQCGGPSHNTDQSRRQIWGELAHILNEGVKVSPSDVV